MGVSTRMYTSVDITIETCWVCGTVFGMATAFSNQLKSKGGGFYCPRGDHLGYGKSEVKKLQEQLAKEKHLREQETAGLRDERDRVEASLRATKGQVTRIKNRVAEGVCPCCQRTFANLGRHMKGQHPEWNQAEVA